jgi:hypothetical protein
LLITVTMIRPAPTVPWWANAATQQGAARQERALPSVEGQSLILAPGGHALLRVAGQDFLARLGATRGGSPGIFG